MALSSLSKSSLYNVQINDGLLAYGGWASVTATTGSPTTGTYTDANGVVWNYYQWTGSGSVTITEGVADVLVVGGGGGRGISGNGQITAGGGAGGYVSGLAKIPAATHTITVGSGGGGGTLVGSVGNRSSLGTVLYAGGGGPGAAAWSTDGNFFLTGTSGGGYQGGILEFDSGGTSPGMGANPNGTYRFDGLSSSITGSSVTYSVGGNSGSPTNYGSGGWSGAGQPGIVIIRVPANPGITVPQQPQGLSGVGNWAYVTATTGSPTKGSYTDGSGTAWTYYQWTGAGSVTTTAGVVDALLVSGGSAAYDDGGGTRNGGNGGAVIAAVIPCAAGTVTVTRGAAGASSGQPGAASFFGTAVSSKGAGAPNLNADGTGASQTSIAGITSSITGSSVEYGRGGLRGGGTTPSGTFGWGGYSGTPGATGTPTVGTVIIRVPSIYALA